MLFEGCCRNLYDFEVSWEFVGRDSFRIASPNPTKRRQWVWVAGASTMGPSRVATPASDQPSMILSLGAHHSFGNGRDIFLPSRGE